MKVEEVQAIAGRDALREKLANVETPAYVYSAAVLAHRLDALRAALGARFDVYYAVKANPHPDVLRFFHVRGTGFDAASIGEVERLIAIGVPPSSIAFTGPGKSEAELARAVALGLGSINVESTGELAALASIARERGARPRVGLRLNPGKLTRGGMRLGHDTQFGIASRDLAEAVRIARDGALAISGVHVHRGSQLGSADAVVDGMKQSIEAAFAVQELAGPFEKLNFGGGLGVDYWSDQRALDLGEVSRGVASLLETDLAKKLDPHTRFIVEPGRFLVAEAGVFVVSIRWVKQGEEKRFAIADGGIHLAALLGGGMGQVVRRDFRHEVLPVLDEGGAEHEVTVCGPLCLPHDVLLARAVWRGREPRPGDRVCFYNAGAYGASASPIGFLGHPPAKEELW